MPISETFMAEIGAAYSVSVMRHCARCLALRHCPSIEARNLSAHSPNVGSASLCRSAIGFRPCATASRQSAASLRAVGEFDRRIGAQAHLTPLAGLLPDEGPGLRARRFHVEIQPAAVAKHSRLRCGLAFRVRQLVERPRHRPSLTLSLTQVRDDSGLWRDNYRRLE